MSAARWTLGAALVLAVLGCGGGQGVGGTALEPPCPDAPWGLYVVEGQVCAMPPTPGEPFAIGMATSIRLNDEESARARRGDPVEVLEVVEVADVATRGHTVRVRHAGGEGTLHSDSLSPWFGDVTVEGTEQRFVLGLQAGRLVLNVGEGGAVLELPEGTAGPVDVAVERWGDELPLFVVSVGDGKVPPFAALVADSTGVRQLSVPDAHAHAAVLAADDPDCSVATPVQVVGGAAERVRELEIPAYRGEPAGPAVCETRGVVGDKPWVVCASGAREVAFLIDGDDRWRRVTCGSDPLLELDRSLQFAGITVVEEPTLRWEP